MVCLGRACRDACRGERRGGKLRPTLTVWTAATWAAEGPERPHRPGGAAGVSSMGDCAGLLSTLSLLTQPGSLQELWPQREPSWFRTLVKCISAAEHESSVLMAETLLWELLEGRFVINGPGSKWLWAQETEGKGTLRRGSFPYLSLSGRRISLCRKPPVRDICVLVFDFSF